MDHPFKAQRALFPSLETNVQLSSCSQSALAIPVRKAVVEYLDSLLERGMDWGLWMGKVSAAKAEFARLINADADEIAVCASVTDAAASVASALDFSGSRNRIVVGELDFPSVGQLWHAQRRQGAQVHFVEAVDHCVSAQAYVSAIDERTRLVSVSQVGFYNGFRQDVEAITRHAHSQGALVFVDAYQSAGSEPIDVKTSGVDMLASGMQKYLLGVPGIAFLYVRRELAQQLEPSNTGWFGRINPFAFDIRQLDYAPNTARFDVGTPPMMAAFAAEAALKIINELGANAICDWQHQLSRVALETAHKCGLAIASPGDLSIKAANTAIRVSNAGALEQQMAAEGYIVSARNDVIRIAPHFYNTEQEVCDAVQLLARLTYY